MVRIWAALCALLVVAAPAVAADDGLKALHDTLTALRTTHGANDERDAGPELTPVKTLLRAWVESKIGGVTFGGDATALANDLDKALKDAGLTCPSDDVCTKHHPNEPDEFDARGYVDGISLSYAGRYLLVETSVGVACGYDESVYLYARGDGDKGWRLALQSEQDDYRDKIYRPQRVTSVQVALSQSPAPLVLTLGVTPWCSSNWQAIYTRIWRIGTQKPLVDDEDTVYLGNESDGTAQVSDTDAIVRYDGGILDGGVLVRNHVVHYLIDAANHVRRIAPVAFNPRDFVDEWLQRPWVESAGWIAHGADMAALRRLYASARDKDNYVSGAFDGDATRCRADPALWQVALNIRSEDGPERYLLVRWLAPYRFALQAIRDKPMPHCDIADPLTDNPN